MDYYLYLWLSNKGIMSKQEFKQQYSDYRKNLSNAYHKGIKAFGEALDTNNLLRSILTSKSDKPVSIRIYLHLNK